VEHAFLAEHEQLELGQQQPAVVGGSIEAEHVRAAAFGIC
jgi:hypothetical protein